jgi:predicted transcriptional regulator
MEQETLFTASKWDILKTLSSGSKSPLQLAKLSNTSVANISQQLRLLEMAGLVQCKRISNRDKGQPRLLYSLVGNQSFLITSASDFVEKKLLQLSEYNKVILKIWFLDKPKLHYFLEKAFWSLDEHMPKIDSIFLNLNQLDSDEVPLFVVSESPELKQGLKRSLIRSRDGVSKTIIFNIKAPNEAKRMISASSAGKFYALYDPSNLIKIKVGEEAK